MTEYDRDQGEVKYGRTQHCVDSDWELGGGKFAGNKSDIIFCSSAHIALLCSHPAAWMQLQSRIRHNDLTELRTVISSFIPLPSMF